MSTIEDILTVYEERDVIAHPKLIEDIFKLYPDERSRDEFSKKFVFQLEKLCEYGHDAAGKPGFKKLKHKDANDLYRMEVNTTNHNVRMIYSFYGKNKLLLHTFFERSGKTATGYETHIPIANKRKAELCVKKIRRLR